MKKNGQLTNQICFKNSTNKFARMSKFDINGDMYTSFNQDENCKSLLTYHFCDNIWTLIFRNVIVTIKEPLNSNYNVKQIVVAYYSKDKRRESKSRKQKLD
ncbi:hypothetical protein B4U80_06918 [Leptotrombidium deliense]|uniref:Transcription initiation factor IIA gamma subunit C-terminal domain-containing protein n=1 Tax=Leptotrombidium deliense TaxID=299467 RepID=A0A443S657_9ACAR|nr:hypothetical protein B4U80_06918 [Leptotrombidium deliense]